MNICKLDTESAVVVHVGIFGIGSLSYLLLLLLIVSSHKKNESMTSSSTL